MITKVKLIRDKLEPCSSSVRFESVRHCYWMHASLLVGKLHEEVAEVADKMDDPSEYADVLQALVDLAQLNGFSLGDIIEVAHSKREERGGFSSGKVMIRK